MKKFINTHAFIGLLQGIVFALFAEFEGSGTVNQLLLLTSTFSVSLALIFVQLTPSLHTVHFRSTSSAWGLLLGYSVLMWGLGYNLLTGLTEDFYGIWFLLTTIGGYFLLPFIQLCANGKKQYQAWITQDYYQLFSHAWCNAILVKFGWLTSLVVWLVLVLWWKLFQVIGIDVFETLFTDKWFAWPVLGAVFGIGIYTAQNQLSIIDNLKRLLLQMCGLLLPLVTLLTLSFVASVIFTGLNSVWNTGIATPLILVLVFINILLINGASLPQDEAQHFLALPQRKILRVMVYINIAALTALMIIAAYSTYLRVDQYGWTVPRVYLSLLVLMMSLYAITYLGLIIKLTTNFDWLRRVNVSVTWAVLAMIILTHNPWFNPVNVTINSQLSRLSNQQVSVDNFDYGLFYFELGKRGKKALDDYVEQQQHPQLAEIKTHIEKIRDVDNKWQWNRLKHQMQAQALQFQWLSPAVISDAALTQLVNEGDFYRDACQRDACYVSAVNIDNDVSMEVLLFIDGSGNGAVVLDSRLETPTQWTVSAHLDVNYNDFENYQTLGESLKQQGINVVKPQYHSISIGDRVFNVIVKRKPQQPADSTTAVAEPIDN